MESYDRTSVYPCLRSLSVITYFRMALNRREICRFLALRAPRPLYAIAAYRFGRMINDFTYGFHLYQ